MGSRAAWHQPIVLQAQICPQEEPTLRPKVCTDCKQETIMFSTWRSPSVSDGNNTAKQDLRP